MIIIDEYHFSCSAAFDTKAPEAATSLIILLINIQLLSMIPISELGGVVYDDDDYNDKKV